MWFKENIPDVLNHYIKVQEEPESIVSERYRDLFTRIERLNSEKRFKTLAITSSVMGEGKTITSLNLSLVMASFNKKVLLIEGDLRNPSFKKYLNIRNNGKKEGIIDVINRGIELESILHTYGTLFLLYAGDLAGKNSSEILNDQKMRDMIENLRERFDYIIIDSPPILPLADVSVLSSLVDFLLIVVKAGETKREIVMKAIDSISKGKILGIILNSVNDRFSNYYYGQYYKL